MLCADVAVRALQGGPASLPKGRPPMGPTKGIAAKAQFYPSSLPRAIGRSSRWPSPQLTYTPTCCLKHLVLGASTCIAWMQCKQLFPLPPGGTTAK